MTTSSIVTTIFTMETAIRQSLFVNETICACPSHVLSTPLSPPKHHFQTPEIFPPDHVSVANMALINLGSGAANPVSNQPMDPALEDDNNAPADCRRTHRMRFLIYERTRLSLPLRSFLISTSPFLYSFSRITSLPCLTRSASRSYFKAFRSASNALISA